MGELNPLTGLPKVNPNQVNPLTGLPMSPSRRPGYLSPFSYGTYGSPTDYESFESRGIQVRPGSDIEELRALRQSSMDQWANGLGKAGVILGTSIVDNTAGFLYGLGEYAAGGFGGFDEFADSMTENPISQFTRSIKESTTEALPNYYTREQQQTTDLLSANFWADKFLGGVAYTAGAMGTAWLTGGTGLLSSSAKLGINAAAAGLKGTKAAAAYAAGKTIASNIAKNTGKVGQAAQIAGQRLPKGLSMLESGTAMSMAEASIEAAEVRDMKIRQGKERYMEENGLTDESQIPLNVLQTIEIQAQQAEGAAFYANLAVLIPTNLIAFGKMLRPMNPHKLNLNSRVISGTDDAGRLVAKDAYAEMGKFGRTAARTRDFVAPYVKGAATESFQEGAQSAIQRGLEEFESDRYYDSGSAELFEVLMKGGSMRTLKESLGDIGDAALSSFQDKDARESMLIGAMIGLITQGKAGFTAIKDSDQRTKESLDLLNNPNFYNLKERAGTTNAAIRYSNLMEQAQERGDMKAYYDYQMLLFQEEALHHVKNGTFDVFVKKLEDASKMTQEELEENGIASGAMLPTSVLNPAAELVNRAKGFIKTVEKINNMFPGTQMPMGAQALFMSKARKEELAQQIKDENIYKSALIRTAAMKDGLDSRISQALTELKDLAPNLDTTKISESRTKQFAKVMGEGKNETLEAPEKNKEIVEEFEKALETIENPVDQALFIQKAGYLVSMLNDRDYVLSAQDNLLRSPEDRDLYVQRAKIREEAELQKARDAVVDKAISETLTADELKDRYSTFENISGEAKTKYDSEHVNRLAEEARTMKKFDQMKKSDIEALTKDNATPLELKLREKYLANRTQEEPVAPKRPEAPTPTPETPADATAESTPSAEDSLEALLEREKKKTEEEVRPKTPAPASTVRDNSNEIVTRTTQNVPEGAASKGQFLLDANGKVIVNANGDPLYSDFNEKRTLNGVPILDQSYLASIDVTVGKEVTLEVIEDDWWLSNKVNFQDSQLENIPIYVKVDDKYVGVLNTGKSSLRATVYREYTKGNNGSVKSKITEKYANNIFNAVDVNGDTVLYNPVESIEEDFYLAYLDENFKWVLGNVEGVRKETLETINAQINSAASVGVNTKLTPGQVAFVLKDPNNQWRTVIGSTAKLSSEDIQVALGHLKKNDSVKFTTLVGTNILPGPGGIRLYYGDKTDNNILIDLIDENGNRLLGDLLGDNLISIDMGTVKSILNGKFKGVESIPQTLKNSLVAEYGVVEVTAKGTEVYGVIPKENNLSPEQVEFIYTNLESLLINLLTQKRYNIARAFINNSKPFTGGATYLEWLTDPRSEDGSYNGRLRTDVRSVNGTVFFDMGLRISDKTSIGQVPTPIIVETPVVVEEVATPVATPAPVEAPTVEVGRDGPRVVKSRKDSKAKKETPVKPAEEKAATDKKYMDALDRNYAAAQKMGIELDEFIETMTSPFPTDIVDLWIKEQQDKNCK